MNVNIIKKEVMPVNIDQETRRQGEIKMEKEKSVLFRVNPVRYEIVSQDIIILGRD